MGRGSLRRVPLSRSSFLRYLRRRQGATTVRKFLRYYTTSLNDVGGEPRRRGPHRAARAGTDVNPRIGRSVAAIKRLFQAYRGRPVAIVLMHGWRFTDHEARLADLARAIGFGDVADALAHRVTPLRPSVFG